MTVYVDDLVEATGTYRGRGARQAYSVGARNGHRWCHLLAAPADREELHEFAAAIGMRPEWWQGDHYDLTPRRRTLAVSLGAVEVSRRDAVKIIGRRG